MGMNDLSINLPKLDVPYFQQTRFSTCGPAALMMVIKYWDKSFELSKAVEFKLWTKSNPFIFFGGTLQFGLAKTALKMGFKAKIYQKASLSEYNSVYSRLLSFWEYLFSRSDHRAKTPIYYGREVLDVVNEALMHSIPPIVFLNLKPILGENVLHWLVVTGIDNQNIYVNDPYIPLNTNLKTKKGYPIELKIFKKAIATDSVGELHLPPCTILVYK
jgi:ABC-type bacteriocin/lantibiotic exporter with double-glycine peptidase domain